MQSEKKTKEIKMTKKKLNRWETWTGRERKNKRGSFLKKHKWKMWIFTTKCFKLFKRFQVYLQIHQFDHRIMYKYRYYLYEKFNWLFVWHFLYCFVCFFCLYVFVWFCMVFVCSFHWFDHSLNWRSDDSGRSSSSYSRSRISRSSSSSSR